MEPSLSSADQDFQEGRWTQEEHRRFLKGIVLHGKDWKIVQTIVLTRQGSQVRSHAQKFFIKLNKISKERRKGKSREIFYPTQIEKEILELFTQADITENTPDEITYVIKREWTIPENLSFSKKQPRKQKHVTELKKLSMPEHPYQIGSIGLEEEEEREKEKEEMHWSEESFFIQILKMSKQHIRNGQEFKNLIDFGQKDLGINDEPQTSINHTFLQGFQCFAQNLPEVRERKQSFGLPNEEEDPQKLKQRLSNLHRALGQ